MNYNIALPSGSIDKWEGKTKLSLSWASCRLFKCVIKSGYNDLDVKTLREMPEEYVIQDLRFLFIKVNLSQVLF